MTFDVSSSSGDVASGGRDDAGDRECGGPGEEDGAAGGCGEEVFGGEALEGVFGAVGAVAADGGDEGEEEVVDDKAPGEQADDRADLAADDGADRGADHAPEGDGGKPAADQERSLPAGEREGDAACVEREGADPESERHAARPSATPARKPAAALAASTRERRGSKRKVGLIVP